MWALSNQTPFPAERTFVRDRDGAEIWLVAVRGTFDLPSSGHEEAKVAKQQLPVVLAPAFRGDPTKTSLLYDGDLPRTKVATDVLINGSAHCRGGQPATELMVGFSVGSVKKQLFVTGDRVVESGEIKDGASRPSPFSVMPITYEKAFGGSVTDKSNPSQSRREDRNPVGIGMDTKVGARLPNISYSGELPRPGTRLRPAGFGAVAAHWAPRVSLAGTYDSKWKKERQPLVPGDFDDRYFQSAPEDQQVHGFLRGGEEVILSNLSPEGTLRFRLPRLTFGFITQIGGEIVNHRGNMHTVIIEPDQRRLIMVWHTSLPCHHTLYSLKETRIVLKERVEKGEM